MQEISSTHAKQNFGELLEAAARAPVAIRKHRRIKAIMASPEYLAAAQGPGVEAIERRLAREQQASVERDRLIRHQRIAIDLLLMPEAESASLTRAALAAVARWEADRLCSQVYIDRWRALLHLPVAEMAKQMNADAGGWGTALRQNSPWAEVMP